MLKFYRQNIKTIIWIIVLSFVAWGVGTLSISSQNSSPYAGSVRGQKITQKEFMMTMRFYEIMIRAQEKEKNDKEKEKSDKDKDKDADTEIKPLSYDQLRALAWQTIILSREAKHQGINITNEDTKLEINKYFPVQDGAGLRIYEQWVQQNFGSRPRDFEEVIRRHLAVQKIREKILFGVPEAERDKYWLQWLTNTIGSTQLKDFTAKEQT